MASERYRFTSETVWTGLRDIEDQDPRFAALRAALVAGEASGEAAPVGLDAFIADKLA